MAYLDWLVEYSEEKNMAIMLCIQHHGQVSTKVNPNWSESPYNVANGGPCATTADFFTHQIAKTHTKNRLKYILARWGYSTSIMSWELFNEVNWTDNALAIETSVASWHAEMASFIKERDVYGHLDTTSTASEDYGKEIWNNPDIDFTQSHIYINNENIERAIVSSSKQRLKEFEKPTLIAAGDESGKRRVSRPEHWAAIRRQASMQSGGAHRHGSTAPAARPGPRAAGPAAAFFKRSPENHSSARRAYRPAMRLNAIAGWQRAMGRAAINAQPRQIVDPCGEMSIGRRSIAIGTR